MNWEELKEAKLPIVIYGMGDGADRILAALAAHPDITITLENQDILPSLQYLQANGWL